MLDRGEGMPFVYLTGGPGSHIVLGQVPECRRLYARLVRKKTLVRYDVRGRGFRARSNRLLPRCLGVGPGGRGRPSRSGQIQFAWCCRSRPGGHHLRLRHQAGRSAAGHLRDNVIMDGAQRALAAIDVVDVTGLLPQMATPNI